MIRADHLHVAGKLTDITIHVAQGEILALVGSRGSGKSTLIRTLAGRLDLLGQMGTRLSRLSPGETARLKLARALMHSPAALLLDEQAGDIDGESESLIAFVLEEEAEAGRAILLATFGYPRMRAITSRVCYLEGGRLIQPTTPARAPPTEAAQPPQAPSVEVRGSARIPHMMPAYFVGWNIPSMTLVEEKEKRVLDAILSTPVHLWQVVAVKGGLAVAFSLVFGAVMVLLMERSPVILVLMFASTLPWEQFRPAVWAAQRYLPTRPAMELLQAGYLGRDMPLMQDGLVMLAYTALLLLACIPLMRRMTFRRA